MATVIWTIYDSRYSKCHFNNVFKYIPKNLSKGMVPVLVGIFKVGNGFCSVCYRYYKYGCPFLFKFGCCKIYNIYNTKLCLLKKPN